MPPLHRTMNHRAWTIVFSQAYEKLNGCYTAGELVLLNPYALENPTKFFAVAREVSFLSPQKLQAELSHVYQQLQFYYRQDSASPPLISGTLLAGWAFLLFRNRVPWLTTTLGGIRGKHSGRDFTAIIAVSGQWSPSDDGPTTQRSL